MIDLYLCIQALINAMQYWRLKIVRVYGYYKFSVVYSKQWTIFSGIYSVFKLLVLLYAVTPGKM